MLSAVRQELTAAATIVQVRQHAAHALAAFNSGFQRASPRWTAK